MQGRRLESDSPENSSIGRFYKFIVTINETGVEVGVRPGNERNFITERDTEANRRE